MKKISTVVPVVAAALIGGDGRILMQQRRLTGAHGGLWEFPGGKIEPGESPESALVREIREELGIAIEAAELSPLAFAGESAPTSQGREPLVILLYICRRWRGEPVCLEGEAIGWYSPGELAGLPMPPLDIPLAQRLVAADQTGPW